MPLQISIPSLHSWRPSNHTPKRGCYNFSFLVFFSLFSPLSHSSAAAAAACSLPRGAAPPHAASDLPTSASRPCVPPAAFPYLVPDRVLHLPLHLPSHLPPPRAPSTSLQLHAIPGRRPPASPRPLARLAPPSSSLSLFRRGTHRSKSPLPQQQEQQGDPNSDARCSKSMPDAPSSPTAPSSAATLRPIALFPPCQVVPSGGRAAGVARPARQNPCRRWPPTSRARCGRLHHEREVTDRFGSDLTTVAVTRPPPAVAGLARLPPASPGAKAWPRLALRHGDPVSSPSSWLGCRPQRRLGPLSRPRIDTFHGSPRRIAISGKERLTCGTHTFGGLKLKLPLELDPFFKDVKYGTGPANKKIEDYFFRSRCRCSNKETPKNPEEWSSRQKVKRRIPG